MPLFAWLERRLLDRRTGEGSGAAVSWQALESAEPALCRAALRFVHAGVLPLPEGARLREEHRVDPDANDWVEVLVDVATRHLSVSDDPRDVAALADVRRVLPSLGCRLAATGRRSTVSGVERLVSLSASKAGAVAHVLEVESAVAGEGLRALVLCDRETAAAELPASLRGRRTGGTAAGAAAPLVAQAGSGLLVLQTLSAAAYPRRVGWVRARPAGCGPCCSPGAAWRRASRWPRSCWPSAPLRTPTWSCGWRRATCPASGGSSAPSGGPRACGRRPSRRSSPRAGPVC